MASTTTTSMSSPPPPPPPAPGPPRITANARYVPPFATLLSCLPFVQVKDEDDSVRHAYTPLFPCRSLMRRVSRDTRTTTRLKKKTLPMQMRSTA
ncbi:hypothetical protein K474DRAFT_1656757 [Panus rudis PR-1116 ss-1]|nr:hypothetical protein K474DRAFT_1656757 [Panus rudis PR-1116 ss-1]